MAYADLDKKRANARKTYALNKERAKAWWAARYYGNLEEMRARQRLANARHRAKNRDKINARYRELRKLKPKQYRKYSLDHYYKYRKKHVAETSLWNKNNRPRINKRNRERLQENIGLRIEHALRNRLWDALHGRRKSKRAHELLGCSIEDFKIYLESKWETGMSWETYGLTGWHIDHIMPCAIFDLTKVEHQKRCFHFSNMQPMWASKNFRKSAKIKDNQYPLI